LTKGSQLQTAAIPYRVADFLKQHPPFQYMDEADLVALAARGRVKFHESDEYICWQASAYTPYIYVIQQGSVSLWDESVDPPVLCDIRGVGDIIGIERFNGFATCLHSAKAASEVILYALEAAAFEPLLAHNPQAAHYVAAYSAVTVNYQASNEGPCPHEIFLADLVRDRAPLQCSTSTPIRDAARLLSASGAPALALTNSDGLAAVLTPSDLLHWIAAGAENPGQPALAISRSAAVTVGPQSRVSDCVLAMAEGRANVAALTSDGSPGSQLQSLVTTASLAPAFGDHPVNILQEISTAPRVASLQAINHRARAWILDQAAAPPAIDWLASFADLVNRRILERLLILNGALHAESNANPPDDFLWCFCGAAGRKELLTGAAPSIAVIGTAPAWLEGALGECGYSSPEPPSAGTLEEWKLRFSGWIRDPIRTQLHGSRPFFDLRPVYGNQELLSELEAHIQTALAAEPAFLRILANDCLSSLPPLTFFRDLVVQESGEETDTFRIESSALQPLVDMARVFSLFCGSPLGAPTRVRLEQARRRLPAHELVFREAAETMRVLLFFQARAGLRLRSSGAELPLPTLSRHDRQVLKSGFRSIHRLLEFTEECAWLEEP
jgi:CBS domain-containing protein